MTRPAHPAARPDDRTDEAAQRRRILEIAQAAIVAMTTAPAYSPSAYAADMIEALDEVAFDGLPETVRHTTIGQSARRVLRRIERIRGGVDQPSTGLGTAGEGAA